MNERFRLMDLVGLLLAVFAFGCFVTLAIRTYQTQNVAGAVVFAGLSILLAAAIHAERTRR